MTRWAAERSDEHLMACLRAGGDGALRVLYERHGRGIYTFARRLLLDAAAAEEILQETFLRIYRDRGTFQPRAAFKTWAFTITRNLCLDVHRSAQRRSEVAADPFPDLADPAPSPFEALDRAEVAARIEGLSTFAVSCGLPSRGGRPGLSAALLFAALAVPYILIVCGGLAAGLTSALIAGTIAGTLAGGPGGTWAGARLPGAAAA